MKTLFKLFLNVMLLCVAFTLYGQQKPPYERTRTNQVMSDYGIWPKYFLGLPQGSSPVIPPWVPDSLKDGALYRDSVAHVTYSYNKGSNTWEPVGGAGLTIDNTAAGNLTSPNFLATYNYITGKLSYMPGFVQYNSTTGNYDAGSHPWNFSNPITAPSITATNGVNAPNNSSHINNLSVYNRLYARDMPESSVADSDYIITMRKGDSTFYKTRVDQLFLPATQHYIDSLVAGLPSLTSSNHFTGQNFFDGNTVYADQGFQAGFNSGSGFAKNLFFLPNFGLHSFPSLLPGGNDNVWFDFNSYPIVPDYDLLYKHASPDHLWYGQLGSEKKILLAGDAAGDLGYTAENATNKATSFGTLNNTLYPTTQAVGTALGGKADTTSYIKRTVGVIHLAGITQLQNYTGTATTINIDTVERGGVFKLITGSATADNGMIFASAISGKYWLRQIEPSGFYKLEWWDIKGDGVTDNTTKIQAAVNYVSSVNGGTLTLFTKGVYLTGSVTWANHVNLQGPGELVFGSDTPTILDNVVFMASLASPEVFNLAGVSKCSFTGISVDGNGSDVSLTTNGFSCSSSTNNIYLYRSKVTNCKYGFYGNSAATITIVESVLRESNINIYDVGDSYIDNNYIGGGRTGNIYINSGQVRIRNNHIEYARLSGTQAAYGITIGVNANRLTIGDNTFDRNAGSDIVANGTGFNRPFQIVIYNNHSKRSAWGTDLTSTQQIAYSLTGIDGLSLTGNMFYAAGYGASSTEGVFSPRQAVNITNCTGVMEADNNTVSNKNKIDLLRLNASGSGTLYTWTASAAGDNSYYLLNSTAGPQGTYNPWVGQPDIIEYNGAYLTAGTIGSLTTGQYAWGDVNSNGFSTLYVRLPADFAPSGVATNVLFAEYSTQPVAIDAASTNVHTQGFKDLLTNQTIAAGATVVYTINTGDVIALNSVKGYTLQITGREATTTTVNLSDILFYIKKSTIMTAYPTLTAIGTTQMQAGFTVATTGATGLVFTLTTDGLGSQVFLSVKNNEANSVVFSAGLSPVISAQPTTYPASQLTGTMAAAQLPATALVSDAVSTATDANYTVTSALQIVKLPVVTAARTVTLPAASGSTGKQIKVWNQNTSGTFLWTFATTVKDASNSTITAIANGSWVILESDGTNWLKIN